MIPLHVRPHQFLCLGSPPCPHDFPLMLPPHVRPHPSLHFCTPTTYHAYAPARPSRYASDAVNSPYTSIPPPHLLRR
ncbi:hypothetical protein O181_028738 [Austropuccinia psidii MF-1]|uniref:Uncharacterized protein n=1 Tax=Austropuccinia psidii MF-1 TaxID=1389203 RepID=A0A9Q3H241_9BASI|nr:hypothetical protein [Austropuccinia psidii MF-1]